MKTMRISILLLLVAVGTMTSSCEKYLEDQIATPNDPVEVNPQLLLASAQVSTFATYTGQLTRQSCLFNQQLAGTDAGSQSIEVANYVITEQTNINEWEGIYSGAVTDSQILIEEFGEASPYYRGLARIFLALNAGIASDLWGDIPLREAGLGNLGGPISPSYDNHVQVLGDIQTLLDQAIVDLSTDIEQNQFVPGSDDLIFGGDLDAWKRVAGALKVRYANRLSEVDPAGSANAVLDILSSADVLTSSGDDAFMPFPGGNGLNQWNAFEGSRGGYYRVNSFFANLLIDNDDPRLPFFLAPDANGGFSGTDTDDITNANSSYVGPIYAGATSPLPLITYVEQKFVEAEVRLRAGQAGPASDAHNEAVITSVTQITGMAPSQEFIDQFASEDASSISLEKIMTQKYIALFVQIESYSDWRRTDIPALNGNGNASCDIPLRLPIPQSERLYNENAPSASGNLCTVLTTPVAWDAD